MYGAFRQSRRSSSPAVIRFYDGRPQAPAHYGGNHDIIDPRTYGKMHGLDFDEISAIKYITRWRKSGNGTRDLDKAIHYLEMLRREAADAHPQSGG